MELASYGARIPGYERRVVIVGQGLARARSDQEEVGEAAAVGSRVCLGPLTGALKEMRIIPTAGCPPRPCRMAKIKNTDTTRSW